MSQCVQHLLGVVDTPSASQTIAFLPFWLGGLGLASAVRGRAAAHWASWADCLRMVRKRHPSVVVLGLERDPAPSLRAVRVCQQTLIDARFPRGTFCLRIPFRRQRLMENLPNRRGDGSKKQLVLSMRDSQVRHARIDLQSFRLLLYRRLRLPFLLCSRTCRCGRPLDILGHHRAACAEAGVLGRRGFLLECAAASLSRGRGSGVH